MKNRFILPSYLRIYITFGAVVCLCFGGKYTAAQQTILNEPYRPQIHFTPKAHWMNDPNGMVFSNGTYHLFYQYYPDSTVWGPMHWGHATSTDLVRWNHQPIALYPDSLGYIFSGSAVIDKTNTSGFGKVGKPPMVAIFTHHNMNGEKNGTSTFQNQSLAYSLDDGKTWTKYAGNPVLKNPGIKDFRDPKVMWYEPTKKWIMTLATLDRITFYSSPDLKHWTKESEVGKDFGAHGGVWECPDLFSLKYGGKIVWVLTVSINPGGPNGGSATQYFTGNFDGKTFTPFETDTRWIDYGPDDYAGVTWSNTGDRKIYLGWMSNWQYATVVPTRNWRSAMTVPRELRLRKVGAKFLVASEPVKELLALQEKIIPLSDIDAADYDLSKKIGKLANPVAIGVSANEIQSFSMTISNGNGEKLIAGYDKTTNQYFIDRTASGKTDFEKGFAKQLVAPRLSVNDHLNITFIIDKASIELFADGGLSVMTAIFFPATPYLDLKLQSPNHYLIQKVQCLSLKSMYTKASR